MLVRVRSVAVAALAGLVLSACGPVVESMRIAAVPLEPRPVDYPIRIYTNTAPRCAFEEIGWLTAEETDFMMNPLMSEHTAERLRARARMLGGDAIVGFRERIRDNGLSTIQTVSSSTKSDSVSATTQTELKTDTSPNVSRRLEGVVVRFTNDGCRD